jgi:BlaI family transcriptional regulator, penicillinase repressor
MTVQCKRYGFRMSKETIELSDGEWAIIKAVWARQPCTAPDVQEALAASKGWAYTTVRTMLDRMAAKGYLSTSKIRHMTLYRAAVTPRQAQRGELLHALKHAFDNALTPMLQCLLDTHDLTPGQLTELEAMLREKRQQAAKKK